MIFEKKIKTLFIVFIYLSFIGMTFTIIQYISFDKNVGFLIYKKNELKNSIWTTFFYIHVLTGFITLIAGFTQFSNYFLNHYKKAHKVMGKIYFYNIVLINFPAAFYLALNALGGITSILAFCLLDILWLLYTSLGFYFIKKGNLLLHKKFFIRSYSLTLTAITFRILQLINSSMLNLEYIEIYKINSWLALIINLTIAEIIINFKFYRANK